ncbi:hypothetical protein ACFLTR_02580 [Chloroflexota bacterium]
MTRGETGVLSIPVSQGKLLDFDLRASNYRFLFFRSLLTAFTTPAKAETCLAVTDMF